MPRSSNKNSPASAIGNGSTRHGQSKCHWSFCYEFDLPNGAWLAAGHTTTGRGRSCGDELGALVDKALAFAG